MADRSYDSLAVKLRGLEDTVEQLVSQVTSSLRKELRAAEDRLTRRIESDQKEEAASLYKVKRDLTAQVSGDVAAAEDRIMRRLDGERRDQKEALAELRREMATQAQSQMQDTANFATQRVVPKESEELSALRSALEDVRTVADSAQKDVMRLAQDMADQRIHCENMETSIRKHLPKQTDELLSLKVAVDKTRLLADEAQKDVQRLSQDFAVQKLRSEQMESSLHTLAAEPRGGGGGGLASNKEDQKFVAAMVGDKDEELRADLTNMLQKMNSDWKKDFQTEFKATQEELSAKTKDLDQLNQRLTKVENSRMDLRIGKPAGPSDRAQGS
ncbi:unnamed protein product [Effrenium voratum]|nr:unnamed protein product [Effrenium voratum]